MVGGALVDGVVPQSGTWSRERSGGWIGWRGASGTWWVASSTPQTVVQEELPEFMDDQLVVLQDVRRASLVVEREPHPCGLSIGLTLL